MLRPCPILTLSLAILGAAHTPALALPDAAIARIAVAGANLRDGDHVPISVELANRGDSPLPPAPVVLSIDEEPYAEWRPPAQVPPGQSAVWSLVWIVTRGSHLIAAVVDPLDDVAESDERNNSASVNVAVGNAPLPSPWPVVFVGGAGWLVGLGAAALAKRLLRKRENGPGAQ